MADKTISRIYVGRWTLQSCMPAISIGQDVWISIESCEFVLFDSSSIMLRGQLVCCGQWNISILWRAKCGLYQQSEDNNFVDRQRLEIWWNGLQLCCGCYWRLQVQHTLKQAYKQTQRQWMMMKTAERMHVSRLQLRYIGGHHIYLGCTRLHCLQTKQTKPHQSKSNPSLGHIIIIRIINVSVGHTILWEIILADSNRTTNWGSSSLLQPCWVMHGTMSRSCRCRCKMNWYCVE